MRLRVLSLAAIGPHWPRGYVSGRHLRLQRLGFLGPARERVGVDVALRGRRLWSPLASRRLLARPASAPRSQRAWPQTHRLSPRPAGFRRCEDARVALVHRGGRRPRPPKPVPVVRPARRVPVTATGASGPRRVAFAELWGHVGVVSKILALPEAPPRGPPHDPEHGLVALLRVGAALEDSGDELTGRRPDLLGPPDEARRRPLGVGSMGAGHVLGHGGRLSVVAPPVRGHAAALEEDLDGRCGVADLDLLAEELEG